MMKKRVLLLLFSLLFAMQLTCVQQDRKIGKQIDSAAQWIMKDKSLSAKKRAKLLRCCGFDESICCKRGKRGHRGPRGPQGRGACGLNELFINAFMMAWFNFGEGQAFDFPPNANFSPYAPNTTMGAWTLLPSTDVFSLVPIGANFNIPIDLDRTQPVTAVIHLLVDSNADVIGDQVALEVNIDYQPDGAILGATFPATGFAQTITVPDFSVTVATPIFSNNMRQISVSVPLDQTLIDGEWSFITVNRIAPALNEFSGNVYLSTISIQYSLICS